MNIPKLCETENISCEDKIIYAFYYLPAVNFMWFIAEIDEEGKYAFGFANLNDPMNAEWGDIYLPELLQNGAYRVDNWKPTKFSDIDQELLFTDKSAEKCFEKITKPQDN